MKLLEVLSKRKVQYIKTRLILKKVGGSFYAKTK